jgi:glycosyltransferase involved in cell wall biosynthesis
MSARPMISTLTSCYRGERYLRTFLERLPEQTAFDRLELVMDLNEPSETELGLVRRFEERYPGHIRYTVQPKVVNYSVSWNNCIRNSTGYYLAVWNLDDLRTKDSIEKEAAVLDHHPDIGIVHGKHMLVTSFEQEDGGPFRDYTHEPESEATRRFLLGPFYMFRKALIEKAGYFDEQFRSSADFDHAVRLALHAKIGAAEGNLGYYLWAGKGLSNKPNSPIDIENFVIRMRYGIYDKMWYHYLAAASAYDYYKILNGTEWIPVSRYVPDYMSMLERRYHYWFDKGYVRHLAFKLKKENFSGIRGVLGGLLGKR